MPRRKSALSLKRLSLFSIARDMDRVWSSDFHSNFRNIPRLLYVMGPFDHLTTELIQDLINILAEQRWLKRHHLQLLFHTHLHQLNLEMCKAIANHDSVIRMIGVRCQTLTKLNLSSLNHISTKVLTDLIINVSSIQSLILQNTKCNDRVMTNIGQFCTKLRELNVFGCPITDTGAFGLCRHSRNGIPTCVELVSLNIGATLISLSGASVLLRDLKNLRYFKYCDVCAVLEKLHKDEVESGLSRPAGSRQYMISSLTATGIQCTIVSPRSIQISCLLCPNVTEVYLHQNIGNKGMKYLKELSRLNVLEVVSSSTDPITFNDGLLPVLQKAGNVLSTLALYDFNDVDVIKIGQYCPQLRHFNMESSMCDYSNFETPNCEENQGLFVYLDTLKMILLSETNNFPGEVLKLMLLNAANITHLHLTNLQSFTDDLFIFMLSRNRLLPLLTLMLELCNSLTKKCILKLLSCESNLQRLDLTECQKITRRDFDNFLNIVKTKNLDLAITWM